MHVFSISKSSSPFFRGNDFDDSASHTIVVDFGDEASAHKVLEVICNNKKSGDHELKSLNSSYVGSKTGTPLELLSVG